MFTPRPGLAIAAHAFRPRSYGSHIGSFRSQSSRSTRDTPQRKAFTPKFRTNPKEHGNLTETMTSDTTQPSSDFIRGDAQSNGHPSTSGEDLDPQDDPPSLESIIPLADNVDEDEKSYDMSETTKGASYLTSQQLSTQLELSSPIDNLRRFLLGPESIIRSRILNERMRKAQSDTLRSRRAVKNGHPQPTLEDWFVRRNPKMDTLRLRAGRDIEETLEIGETEKDSGYDSVSRFDDEYEPNILHGKKAAYHYSGTRNLSPGRKPEQDVHHRQTLTADLIRFQIRACRSPEDVLRVVTVSLRPLPNPEHASSDAPTTPASRHSSSLTNPAAHYLSSPHVQYNIAMILSRPPPDQAYGPVNAASTHPETTLEPPKSSEPLYDPTRVLACLNTLLHRFNTHIPPLSVDISIITCALQAAAVSLNYSSLRLWTHALKKWRDTKLSQLSQLSQPNAYYIYTQRNQSMVASTLSTLYSAVVGPDVDADTLPAPLPAKEGAALKLSLSELCDMMGEHDWVAHRTYVSLLVACGPAAKDTLADLWTAVSSRPYIRYGAPPLTRRSNARIKKYTLAVADGDKVRYNSLRNLHRKRKRRQHATRATQDAAAQMLPADFVDAFSALGDKESAWQVFQRTAFSAGLFGAAGTDRDLPTLKWPPGRERLFGFLLAEFEKGGSIPRLRLTEEENAVLVVHLERQLTERLMELEETLGVRWDGDTHVMQGRSAMAMFESLAGEV